MAEGYVKIEKGKPVYVYNYTDHLGNVRLSYTDKNGIAQVLQEKNYYPFGLTHKGYNESTDALAQGYKYGYNGKELQNEVDLNWYDYGARNYSPALGRWFVIDPLAEKYLGVAPYVYVANNPIIFIDPDGKQIDPSSQEEWYKQKQNIIAERDKLQGNIDGLNDKATKKGWSAKKLANRIGNMQDRVNGLNDVISNLDILEASTQVYSLNSRAAQNEISYNTFNGNIVINYSGTALFTHETTHASQFETGDIAFDSSTGNTLAQDVYDEVEGYKAQWAYDPSSVGGLSLSQITPNWIQSVTEPITGNQPYKQGGTANTGIRPVNINSTRNDLIKAYPHLKSTLQTLPASATLKSIVPTIYTKIK